MLFILCLKLFSFLTYLHFVEKLLDQKLWLISIFMTPQAEQKLITIHILPNISRSKGKQTIKFDQLIEYNTSNIFLETGGEASPQTFL